jgi:NOL1/NOP2/sun family putative RNA methylase
VQLPDKLLKSLESVNGFDRKAFERVHGSGEQVTSIRINPKKNFEFRISNFEFSRVPWSERGYYLTQRPSFTFDPLFHAGCYYVQEASSMFLEQALRQTVDLSKTLKVLDLAAAPGGKTTHIQSLISKDSLLVSNEVIKSRANILKDNVVKWGADNVIVTNNDPKSFARLESYFDVIVVDAPCSGSGLFRRDEEAIDEWSPNHVQLCSQRQRRILADVWPALKKDGILIYSTCSYSKEEDEEIIQWMMENFTIANCQLTIDNSWGIVETENGYRFWPDKVKGEGFFIACLKKLDDERAFDRKIKDKLEVLDKNEIRIVKDWVVESNYQFFKIRNETHAISDNLLKELNILLAHLRIHYSGITIGEIIRERLIPGHALALSDLVSDQIEKVELNYEDAIAYLRKQELKNITIKSKGWKLATHKSYPLGWINVLPTRINNYYPKELRILKDI